MSRPADFSRRLLDWWDQHGRKDLPWQHPRTPYRIWVSEIMLQQTQVATVIPYFERWMKRFPDLAELAVSPLDEVLAHWAGLGYYARARNLHKTARLCLEHHDGALPASADELEKLPGIGLSTANAIVSQATDQPASVLDGNVRRVLARHARVEGWSGSATVQKQLWSEAEARLPEHRGADYTQAIMDLGAMVCTRKRPACETCPMQADCKALEADEVNLYPTPKPKTRVNDRAMFMLVLQDKKQRILLEKRPPAGIWGGLWCLPSAGDLQQLEAETGLKLADSRHLSPREHRLSHLRLSIQPVQPNKVRAEQVKCSGDHCWVTPGQLREFGVPKPVADILRGLQNGELA